MNKKEQWRKQQHDFYVSGVWIDCARAYRRSHPYCEQCLREHVITPAEEVHHKVHLSPENINDPMVALNWENLEAICEKHHKAEHKGLTERRWEIGPDGSVQVRESPLVGNLRAGGLNSQGG